MMEDAKTRLADLIEQEAADEAVERLHQARTDWLAVIGDDEEPAAYRRFRAAMDEAP